MRAQVADSSGTTLKKFAAEKNTTALEGMPRSVRSSLRVIGSNARHGAFRAFPRQIDRRIRDAARVVGQRAAVVLDGVQDERAALARKALEMRQHEIDLGLRPEMVAQDPDAQPPAGGGLR